MIPSAKQSVVVYRDGGEQAVRRCVERKGTFANVRSLYAEDFAAEQLRKRSK